MNNYGVGVQLQGFLTSARDDGEVPNSQAAAVSPGEELPASVVQEPGWVPQPIRAPSIR